MKPEVKEIIIDNERIFLAKSKIFGWNIVNPMVIDGKRNWKNILIGGNWGRFWFLAIVTILFLLAIQEYKIIVNIANECLEKANSYILIK